MWSDGPLQRRGIRRGHAQGHGTACGGLSVFHEVHLSREKS